MVTIVFYLFVMNVYISPPHSPELAICHMCCWISSLPCPPNRRPSIWLSVSKAHSWSSFSSKSVRGSTLAPQVPAALRSSSSPPWEAPHRRPRLKPLGHRTLNQRGRRSQDGRLGESMAGRRSTRRSTGWASQRHRGAWRSCCSRRVRRLEPRTPTDVTRCAMPAPLAMPRSLRP